ncbi:MAG TPA: Smr/MutS family protein [Burkholderiales bacterium]|nr:Smr/MutS family protein [Burkholderiales bacterium]
MSAATGPAMHKPTDDAEFRKAVAGVQPLTVARRVTQRKSPPPAPVARQTERDVQAVLAESLAGPFTVDDEFDSGEELSFLREGLPRQVLRRLRRGDWVVQDSLDLHGMDRVQAALAVAAFLRDCCAHGLRCVRIVHGKGLGSKNRRPVLKGKLHKWLTPRDEVLAYCQSPDTDGGSGAVLVLLRARR